MGIRITHDSLRPGLRRAPKQLDTAIRGVMEYQRPRIQSAARSGAPWTDQTGNARQGLMARRGQSGTTYYIDLYHSVPYGIWLEVRWSGRYQIILPTILEGGRAVMGQLNNVLGRLR